MATQALDPLFAPPSIDLAALEVPPVPPAIQPLLTIAIPTYNRAALLDSLLRVLTPQLRNRPEIELLICDNASTDDTKLVVDRRGPDRCRYHHHAENLGSDANFVSAFQLARGRYFWLLSDDDIPVPNTIEDLLSHLRAEEYDLIYATSYGYREDWLKERQADPLGRVSHTITDPRELARVVNIMFTFISGMIVNRERLLALREDGLVIEEPSAFIGTHLTQLSWTLPLLRRHRKSLVLWQRPIAARLGHNGGYELGRVFGRQLCETTARCLPDRPDLAQIILDFALRRWFPSVIYDIRTSGNQGFALGEAHRALKPVFGTNSRYWLFTYPVLVMPLRLARLWLKGGAAFSKVVYAFSVPGFWRKRT